MQSLHHSIFSHLHISLMASGEYPIFINSRLISLTNFFSLIIYLPPKVKAEGLVFANAIRNEGAKDGGYGERG
jgi:hypothetical protein